MAEARIKAVITAEDRASSVLRGFDNKVNGIGKSIRNLILGGAGLYALNKAIRAGVGFIWDSVEAFAEEEIVITRLQAGINNVTSARSKSIKGLLDQAAALQQVTRFSDDQIISAQGILTTFQLNQKAIEAITPRLIDMSEGVARVSGELPDLEGNAMLVAKAIGGEDVEGMVGALRRVGVIMTAHQMEILKTGTYQQRLAIITKVLDNNFKNMGTTAGSTTAGRLAQLRNSLGDLQEQFGSTIAKAITPFIQKLTAWARTDQARAVVQSIANRVVQMGTAFANFLRNNWPQIKSTLITLARLAWNIAQAIAFIAKVASIAFNALMKLAKVMPGSGLPDDIKKRLPISGAFQHGGIAPGGQAALVGEAGPEMIVPKRDVRVIPNHQLGGSVSLNVNIGMYAGTPMERRKIAEIIFKDLQDVARMKGQTTAQMLGAA